MVRILGILVGLGFCGVAAWSLLWGVVQYLKEPPQTTVEARFHEHPRHDAHFEFAGPFGRFSHNTQQLQRGMQVYREVCSSCHPVYTGREQRVASGGRIERFETRRRRALATNA